MRTAKKKTKSQQSATRNKALLKGKGDYNVGTSEFAALQSKLDRIDKKLPDVKSGLSNVGSRIGGLFGVPSLGKQAGEGVSKLLGFGDYHLVSNSLIKSTGGENFVPKFDSKTNGIRVREREYLGDIVSSGSVGAFQNTAYPITPTSSMTFPWLSTVAKQFDQWEPNGIVFEFVSISSDFNGSAQALGSVVLATDYDVLDTPYATKVAMANADYSSSCKPSCNQMHGIECDPSQRPYKTMYTRPFDRPIANNNTLGNFQVATSGVSAAGVHLGELWVSYDVTFYKKQLEVVSIPSFVLDLVYDTTTSIWTITDTINHSGFTTSVVPTAPNQLNIKFPVGIDKGRFLFEVVEIYYAGSPTPLLPVYGFTVVDTRASAIVPGAVWKISVLMDVTLSAPVALYTNSGISSSDRISIIQVTDDFVI